MQIKIIYKDRKGICRERNLEELIPDMKLLKIAFSPGELKKEKMFLDSGESIVYLGRSEHMGKNICPIETSVIP